MTTKKDEEKKPVRNPVQWLVNTALMVLGIAIALQLAIDILVDLLPWIVGLGLVVGVAYLVWRIRDAQRRRW
ncbi:hypothetical protein ACWZJV_05450 [Nocardioides sp. WG-D5]